MKVLKEVKAAGRRIGLALNLGSIFIDSSMITTNYANAATYPYRFGRSTTYDVGMSETTLDTLKSRLSMLLPGEQLFASGESVETLANVKVKAKRRKWTERDYAMRGIKPRGQTASLHVNIDPLAVELAWEMARTDGGSLGTWVEKLILAEAERGAS